MKTTTDLFLSFTSNRNPNIIRPTHGVYTSDKLEYMISEKQSLWLSNLIFAKASKVQGGVLQTTSQYFETINGYNYCLIQGKKTNRISVQKIN